MEVTPFGTAVVPEACSLPICECSLWKLVSHSAADIRDGEGVGLDVGDTLTRPSIRCSASGAGAVWTALTAFGGGTVSRIVDCVEAFDAGPSGALGGNGHAAGDLPRFILGKHLNTVPESAVSNA